MKLKELLEKYGEVEITKDTEKELKKLLEIKHSKKWKPETNETYFTITNSGRIYSSNQDNCIADDYRYFTNNMFETKEEAEFRLEQINVYNELKNFADENNDEINWKNLDNNYKYCILFDCDINKLTIDCSCCYIRMGSIYFSSAELAKQAIEKVGEDRIKKYLFEVE